MPDRCDPTSYRASGRDFLSATLLDPKFERQETPNLIRWLYALTLVVAFRTLFGLL